MTYLFCDSYCVPVRDADCLVSVVVKASASGAADLGSIPAFAVDHFLGRIIPVTYKLILQKATLPGAWRYRVIAGTGWPGVSILWLGEI